MAGEWIGGGCAPSTAPGVARRASSEARPDRGGDDPGLPPDFAVTDSLHLPDSERPSLLDAVSNPRDGLALLLLLCGAAVSYHNIIGDYSRTYQGWELLSVILGFASLLAALAQLRSGYRISPRPRRGVIDDAVMNLYAGMYSGSVSWLALRSSALCPTWLEPWDVVLPWIAAGVFGFSLAAPIVTLAEDGKGRDIAGSTDGNRDGSLSAAMTRYARIATGLSPPDALSLRVPSALSETELFRTKGLLAIGVLGCVFVPDCAAFALGSSEWWDRVAELHPSQRILESSTALFALFATEASMVATRAANKGLAPYRVMVPAFAGVCLLLAVIPCASSLYWLGNDVSFFSFYRE